MKVAGAPISWGVCEVPDWGLQLAPDRVLSDMHQLGLSATEAGPPGFLPTDAPVARSLLESKGLRLVAGFVTAVLHDRSRRADELAAVTRQAAWLADTGAELLVLAAATGQVGYSAVSGLADEGWRTLFEGMDRVAEIASRRGLIVAVHPHFGTMIERPDHISRFLDATAHEICLDTGHIALGGADPVKVARDAGTRVRHVHLKDVDPALASQVRDGAIPYSRAIRRGLFVTLGQGGARIAEVLALLRSAGYGGWYVLEQDVMLDRAPDEGPPDWVARSIEFARRHG